MSIEIPKDVHAAPATQDGDHLRSGLFVPGEKQAFAPGDLTHTELMARNEILSQEIHAQIKRIAEATVNSVATLPQQWQENFYQGISCYAGKTDEPAYAAVFKQRDMTV